jgi:hypothetical protein
MQQPEQAGVILGGGLDLITPPLQVLPGVVIQAKNYECDLNNGYREMAGYERFDGRYSPTATLFYAVPLSSITGWVVAETITGSTSGATAVIFQISTAGLYVTEVVGTFTAAETIVGSTSSTSQAITFVYPNVTLIDADAFLDVRYNKEIFLRDKITVVPGVGSVLGAFRHQALALAVRNFDVTNARMYKSTTAGWEQVATSHIIFFDAVADFDLLVQGVTVNDDAGNTATLIGVSRQDTGSNTGYVVVIGYTAGFANNALLKVSTTTAVTISADAAEVVLLANGKYEWEPHNFTGGLNRYRVYGCDGVNPAFEYDVTYNAIVPIYTDQANKSADIPTFVSVYRNHLFLAFERGIVRNSEPGNPFLWDAAAGTLEIAVGATPTGFDSTAKALLIATARLTQALTGTVAETFELNIASQNAGARAYTMAHISTTHMLNDLGVQSITRTDTFGSFADQTISEIVQPAINQLIDTVVANTVVLKNNIYKLFTSSGTGIAATFQKGQVTGFMPFDLGIPVNTVSNANDETGSERILIGSGTGFVYEMERGRSFDGAEKETWMRTAYAFLESPNFRKKFLRASVGVIITGKATLTINADYSLGSSDVLNIRTLTSQIDGPNSSFDVAQFDNAVFDGKLVATAYLDLEGTGDSISLVINHSSAKDDIFSLKDILYTYKRRRIQRAAR